MSGRSLCVDRVQRVDSDLARLIAAGDEAAEEMLLKTGAAPDTEDEFWEVTGAFVSSYVASELDDNQKRLIEDLDHGGRQIKLSDAVNGRESAAKRAMYALGVAMGLRLARSGE